MSVKGCNTIDVSNRDIERGCNVTNNVFGEVFVDLLNFLKYGNQPSRVILILLKNLVDCAQMPDHCPGFFNRFLHDRRKVKSEK